MSINDSSQDLVVGVDFTGIASPEAADFNNGVDLATPASESDSEGKGIILTTTDTALDVPDVPNPATSADYAKWKRYQWNRRPFAGAAIKNCKTYQWNDDAPNDATFLKWLETFVDTTDIEAVANNALATANNAVTIANNAGALAADAKDVADTAQSQVDAATTLANTAIANAATADGKAVAAQTTANTAAANATQALALVPRQSIFSKFSETKPKGTDAGASAAGKNTRVLNTVNYNGANSNVALNVLTGLITVAVGAYYYIEAVAIMYDDNATQHQLFVVDDATGNNLLEGISMYYVPGGGATAQQGKVCGIVQLANAQVIRLDHYIANVQAANGLGRAANINPDAAGKEVYAELIIFPIGGN